MRTVIVKDCTGDVITITKPEGWDLCIRTHGIDYFYFTYSKSSIRALRKLIAALQAGLAELEA